MFRETLFIKIMEFLIITGLSGAGKTRAADIIEDMGYYCVDNMPAEIMPKFAEFCAAGGGHFEKVALVSDIREKGGVASLIKALDTLSGMDCHLKVLFMSADTPTLVHRYKETRRRHPIAQSGETVEQSIEREKKLMEPVLERADYVIDSSNQPLNRLQHKLETILLGEEGKTDIDISVESFGYKYGIPADSDLVFDARFLPNPYYVDELRELNGMDAAVSDYIFSFSETGEILNKLLDMIDYLIPLYREEGKTSLVIAIGCTGGRHRSVALANAISKHLIERGYSAELINRDYKK